MSYYRNRPFFGPRSGLRTVPVRTPRSATQTGAARGPHQAQPTTPATRPEANGPAPAWASHERPVESQAAGSTRSGDSGPATAVKVEDLASEREPKADMESEITRLRALVAEKDQHAREAAVRARLATEELERAKQRIRKDALKDAEQRNRAVLRSFLEVVDDLDRAIAVARERTEDSAMLQGVELVRKRFIDKLAHHDVTHRPSQGCRFDPAVHEAMSIVPVADASLDGVIIGVVREGYEIGDEVLRPAAVAVGRHSGSKPVDPRDN